MFNLISLRLMKFFVDFLYYALPVFYWIFRVAFYSLIAALILILVVIIL